jgi:hypothetical protein
MERRTNGNIMPGLSVSKFHNRSEGMTRLGIAGELIKIGTPTVTVLQTDASGMVTRAQGATVPTDADAGYALGCQFIDTDGAAGAQLYINEGSATSCDFNLVPMPTAKGQNLYTTVSITNTEFLALRATPKEIVAAPGAGNIIEFIAAEILIDYTAAYTETDDNLAFKYENGSGQAASETVECTGFVDATADSIMPAKPVTSAVILASAGVNKALVLHNTGNGEFGAGNAANVIRVKIAYRIHATSF